MVCEITWLLAITCALEEFQNSFGTNVIFKEIHANTKQPIRFQGSFKVTNQIKGKRKTNRPFLNISKVYQVYLTLSVNLKIQLDFHPGAKLNIFHEELLSNSFTELVYIYSIELIHIRQQQH